MRQRASSRSSAEEKPSWRRPAGRVQVGIDGLIALGDQGEAAVAAIERGACRDGSTRKAPTATIREAGGGNQARGERAAAGIPRRHCASAMRSRLPRPAATALPVAPLRSRTPTSASRHPSASRAGEEERPGLHVLAERRQRQDHGGGDRRGGQRRFDAAPPPGKRRQASRPERLLAGLTCQEPPRGDAPRRRTVARIVSMAASRPLA